MTKEISRYDVACRALAEAKTLEEIKDVSDKASAIQEYARRAKNKTLEIDAAELRMRAERKLGEILKNTKKNVGAKGSKVTGSKQEPVRDKTPTLSALGIDKKLSSRAQKLANQVTEKFEENISKWRSHAQKENERVSTTQLLRMEITHYIKFHKGVGTNWKDCSQLDAKNFCLC